MEAYTRVTKRKYGAIGKPKLDVEVSEPQERSHESSPSSPSTSCQSRSSSLSRPRASPRSLKRSSSSIVPLNQSAKAAQGIRIEHATRASSPLKISSTPKLEVPSSNQTLLKLRRAISYNTGLFTNPLLTPPTEHSDSSATTDSGNGASSGPRNPRSVSRSAPPPQNLAARNEALLARLKARKASTSSSGSRNSANATDDEDGAAGEYGNSIAQSRADDVLRILIMLVGSRKRATFPSAEIVKNVQASVKSPLSKTEICQCMKILESGQRKNAEVIKTVVGGIENWTVVCGTKGGLDY